MSEEKNIEECWFVSEQSVHKIWVAKGENEYAGYRRTTMRAYRRPIFADPQLTPERVGELLNEASNRRGLAAI